MAAPIVLLVVSLVGVAVAIVVPDLSDLLLVAVPALLASLYLLLRARIAARRAGKPKWIVIDGSNVMHWADDTPRIETVRDVVQHLQGLGFTPGVVFDANAGYLLHGRYQHDGALGKLLGLPRDRVMVVSKGEPADPTILVAARDMSAPVVTNDRFRDWAEQFPEVRRSGFLIRGGYRDGRLWLSPDPARPTSPAATTVTAARV